MSSSLAMEYDRDVALPATDGPRIGRAQVLDCGKSRNGHRAPSLRAGLRGRHPPR